jgi:hypothetical protein
MILDLCPSNIFDVKALLILHTYGATVTNLQVDLSVLNYMTAIMVAIMKTNVNIDTAEANQGFLRYPYELV